MSWINFDDKYPDKFPCVARNYNLHIQDVIFGIDKNNFNFKHACFCKSLPIKGMSMPFTHWKPID